MRLHPFRGWRLAPLLCGSLAVASLGVACGNNGSAGDGATTDDGSSRAGGLGFGDAGARNNQAGARNTNGGNQGRDGTAGSPSSSAGASVGSASGAGGASGGSGGKGGASGGASASGGKAGSAGGSSIGGASGGNPSTGGVGGSVVGGAGTGAFSGGGTGTVSLTCGNGTVESGEECDSPMDSVGGGSGDGSGGSPAKYGQICSNNCFKVGTQACVDCEMADVCSEAVDGCLGPADTPFSAQQRAQCYAVMHCVQASNCFDGTKSLGDNCYCGSLSTTACGSAPFTGPGSPDGPCKAEFQAGMTGLSSNSSLLAQLQGPDRPTGAAGKRLTCQKTSNNGVTHQTCAATCGFTSTTPFP